MEAAAESSDSGSSAHPLRAKLEAAFDQMAGYDEWSMSIDPGLEVRATPGYVELFISKPTVSSRPALQMYDALLLSLWNCNLADVPGYKQTAQELLLQELAMRSKLKYYRAKFNLWLSKHLSRHRGKKATAPICSFQCVAHDQGVRFLQWFEEQDREGLQQSCVLTDPLSFSAVTVLGADKGLICLILPSEELPPGAHSWAFVVCNPFLGVHRVLPTLSIRVRHGATFDVTAALVVNRSLESNSYKVVLSAREVLGDSCSWILHIFSSQTGAWNRYQQDDIDIPAFDRNQLYYCLVGDDFKIYNLLYTHGELVAVTYQLDLGKISECDDVAMPGRKSPSEFGSVRALLRHGEDLYVVNEADPPAGSTLLQIGIWKANHDSEIDDWEEVSIMPEEMSLQKDIHLEGSRITVNGAVAIGDVICLDVDVYHICETKILEFPPRRTSLPPHVERKRQVVTFDMSTGVWNVVTRAGEECSYRLGEDPVVRNAMTIFEPRMDVTP